MTPEVLTGGGGRHFYFAHPGHEVKCGTYLGDGIDVKGDGSYVVAPPSVHKSGRTYEWELSSHADDVLCAELPAWALRTDTCRSSRTISEHAVVLEGVAAGSRNTAATHLAGVVFAKGLGVEHALLLLRGWNLGNKPPLEDAELRKVVGSVVKADVRNHPERWEAPPQMYELCDLLAKEFPPTPSLVGDKLVIPGGVAILAAQPKVGKSYLVMQLALARAYDRPWIGFSTTPGRTLYINTEIVEVECQARFRQLTARGGHPLRGAVHVATLLGHALNRPEDFDLIAGHIERTDVDLIIIDCLSSFLDGDESSQEHIKPFLQAVNQLRARYGVAVLVVHHHRKPPRESKGKFSPTAHDMSGSGLLFRWPDTVITAEKLTDGVKLSFDTRHAAAPEPFKVVRGPDLWWSPATAALLPAHLVDPLLLLRHRALRHGEWVRELEARGISNSTARRYIERAAPFVSKADGVYTLTEPTQEALIANAHEPMSAVPSGEADAHDAHARSHDALSVKEGA